MAGCEAARDGDVYPEHPGHPVGFLGFKKTHDILAGARSSAPAWHGGGLMRRVELHGEVVRLRGRCNAPYDMCWRACHEARAFSMSVFPSMRQGVADCES